MVFTHYSSYVPCFSYAMIITKWVCIYKLILASHYDFHITLYLLSALIIPMALPTPYLMLDLPQACLHCSVKAKISYFDFASQHTAELHYTNKEKCMKYWLILKKYKLLYMYWEGIIAKTLKIQLGKRGRRRGSK